MRDDFGKMPEANIDRPATPFVQLKVADLTPEHGDAFLGVGDVAVDANRECWALLDAPVFGADFQDVAPLIIRRTREGGYEVRMDGLPDGSNFTPVPSPDASTWVSVRVV